MTTSRGPIPVTVGTFEAYHWWRGGGDTIGGGGGRGGWERRTQNHIWVSSSSSQVPRVNFKYAVHVRAYVGVQGLGLRG